MLSILVDDVGGPLKAARIVRVHVATVRRWLRTDRYPEAAYAALYARTRWGRRDRYVMTEHERRTLHALVAALRVELEELKARHARLVALGSPGAANGPDWRGVTGAS